MVAISVSIVKFFRRFGDPLASAVRGRCDFSSSMVQNHPNDSANPAQRIEQNVGKTRSAVWDE
jgi:hypothetical protein